jgi:hypothetical protein
MLKVNLLSHVMGRLKLVRQSLRDLRLVQPQAVGDYGVGVQVSGKKQSTETWKLIRLRRNTRILNIYT